MAAHPCDCCGDGGRAATLVLTPTGKLPRCHYCHEGLFPDATSATVALCALDCPNQGFEEIDVKDDGTGRLTHWDKVSEPRGSARGACGSHCETAVVGGSLDARTAC